MKIHAIQAAADDAGLDTRNYSGRGMYGKDCLGIVFDNLGQLLQSIAYGAANESFSEKEIQDLSNARTDSMGLSSIIYFPNIKYATPDQDDEGEEDEETAEED